MNLKLTGNDGAWIFPTVEDGAVNIYADFLHGFLASPSMDPCKLIVSADTDFKVWLNGVPIGEGQYSDYPDCKTFECFDVTKHVQDGENCLAFTVFYNGRNSSVYRRGDPGLFFKLCQGDEVLACSGTDTLTRFNPAYHSGPIAVVSGQLAYTFGYDAGKVDLFHSPDFKPSSDWRQILPEESRLPSNRTTLSPRPVSRLVDNGLTSTKLVSAGMFTRNQKQIEAKLGKAIESESLAGFTLDDGTLISPGWLMQHDTLEELSALELTSVSPMTELGSLDNGLSIKLDSLGDHDGVYLIFDMAREEAGYLEIEFEAPAGTIIDIGYGEHLDDCRPRTFIGSRSFAGRLIAGDGRFAFRHEYLRWSGRYLSIHVGGADFSLYRLGLRRRDYPVKDRGTLETTNPLIQDITAVSRRTLSLCMHEHYEDTPWREQALYANDARTQALCGYFAFGETAFPRSSFNLLGHGLREDGYLELTAPARPRVTIPSFTLVWMLAVRDHYLYSGDASLAAAFLPQIESMLERFLAKREDGLMTLDPEKDVWHFYDWSGDMSGYSQEQLADGLRVDAPLNCFLVLAIEAACEIRQWLGMQKQPHLEAVMNEIQQAVADRFWNREQGAFRTIETSEALTELTQALAILAKVGDASMQDQVAERLNQSDSGLAKPGLSQSFYTYSARLMKNRQNEGQRVFQEIESTWATMLRAGATSFWETIKGASDFSNAGSLCHGWSAGPLYFYFRDLLGIRPVEPGFKTFIVEPTPGYINACEGIVPIPGGEIAINWRQEDGQIACSVKAPAACKCLPGNHDVVIV